MTTSTQGNDLERLLATDRTFVVGANEALALSPDQTLLLSSHSRDERVAEAQAELLTAAARVISQRPGIPKELVAATATLIRSYPGAHPSSGLLEAALAVVSGGPYDPVKVPQPELAGQPIIDAVVDRCGDWLQNEDPAAFQRIGSSIDRWRQATGVDGPNPTGVWAVRPDAVALGWRRPRLERPPSKPGESPPLPSVLELGLRLLHGYDHAERLVELVEHGMNLELAEEIAQNGGLDLDA